jgi:hypothetical protein
VGGIAVKGLYNYSFGIDGSFVAIGRNNSRAYEKNNANSPETTMFHQTTP